MGLCSTDQREVHQAVQRHLLSHEYCMLLFYEETVELKFQRDRKMLVNMKDVWIQQEQTESKKIMHSTWNEI